MRLWPSGKRANRVAVPGENTMTSVEPTRIESYVDTGMFFRQAAMAVTSKHIGELLSQLPIVDENDYAFDAKSPEKDWQKGSFHWIPVGKERGNAGRIKLANQPVNPIAERLVNGMEAIIELSRQRELSDDPQSEPPASPRESVKRYFDLPPFDQLPRMEGVIRSQKPRDYAREVSKSLRVRLIWDKPLREFAVVIEDDGIGQAPAAVHETLLSLGSTTKGDKTYLIGVFGQGGSSAYAASEYSWVLSRRAPDLLHGHEDGVSWTIIRHIFPRGRRDDYFAYLASSPFGSVPVFPADLADSIGMRHGTRFAHINYNFGKGGAAVSRNLYPALNHILFSPVLPYELYAGRDTPDPMYGNAYRLSLLSLKRIPPALDKTFAPQPVGIS